MTPIDILAALILLVFGFVIGRRSGVKSVRLFSDPDVAHDMSEKGRMVVETRINKRKKRILEQAKATGKITNDDVEDLFCISDSTARNYLNELEQEGKLSQVGTTGHGVHYTPR
jgi:predicted HTH transcriptional regulator